MRGDDLCNQFGDGRASLEFCGVGIRLRNIALKAVFAPELEFLLDAKATLPDAQSIDVPRLQYKGGVCQNAGRSDLMDRGIEVERGRRHRRIKALGDCDDAFDRRPRHGLIACHCRRRPQHCCDCSDCSEPNDSDRADHGVALITSLFSTVPVSPCTFAPSESCQHPAMLSVALHLERPGSVACMHVTVVTLSLMPSGATASRVAK